jgi:hypothetical protein
MVKEGGGRKEGRRRKKGKNVLNSQYTLHKLIESGFPSV